MNLVQLQVEDATRRLVSLDGDGHAGGLFLEQTYKVK